MNREEAKKKAREQMDKWESKRNDGQTLKRDPQHKNRG